MKAFGSITGIALVFVYAIGSGLWVNTGDNWYRSLNAPSWQPPDFVFGIIWPYNFLVLGFAAVNVSQKLSSVWVLTYMGIFAITVVAALVWAYQFYRPHNLSTASLALTIVAILTIPLLIITFRSSTTIGALLIPYQLWVITAASLSWSYAKLN